MTKLPDTSTFPEVSILRYESTDQGTFGLVRCPAQDIKLHSIELPWRDNQPNVSCIPAGKYRCFVRQTSKYGMAYEVGEVPGRTAILIHLGNWAGDTEKGFRSNSYGCILLGLCRGIVYEQRAILNSRAAIYEFMDKMNRQPFTLNILDKGESDA